MSMINASITTNAHTPVWYVFDKIYNKPAGQLLQEASSDGIFVGRYVLIKYCDTLLTLEQRLEIEQLIMANQPMPENFTAEQQQYYKNYNEELKLGSFTTSQDRTIFYKIFKNGRLTYEPLCNLHNYSIANNGNDTPEGDIVTSHEIFILVSNGDIAEDEELLNEIKNAQPGDMAIIRRTIVDDYNQNTVYVLNNLNRWIALDQNYNASNTFLDKNIINNDNTVLLEKGSSVFDAISQLAKQIYDMQIIGNTMTWNDYYLTEEV